MLCEGESIGAVMVTDDIILRPVSHLSLQYPPYQSLVQMPLTPSGVPNRCSSVSLYGDFILL